MNLNLIQTVLKKHQPKKLLRGQAIASAVLVPLRLTAQDEFEIILTRRSAQLLAHAGQVAFPGGRVDAKDTSVIATALREAHEELNIAPDQVQVLGQLDDMLAITGYHVVPVVGLVDPKAQLVAHSFEVARIFAVPLTLLMDETLWHAQQHVYRQEPIWHFWFQDEDVWGITAHILRGFIELLWKNQ